MAIETRAGCWSPACAPPAAGLRGQPDGGGPLPGPALGRGPQVRHGDAVVLANVLRTDLHAHRPLPADSELAQAIAVLARAQQDAVWDRTAAQQQAPLAPARVLPRLPRRLRRRPRRHHAPRGPRHPGRRPHPGRRGHAHPGPARAPCCARPAAAAASTPRPRGCAPPSRQEQMRQLPLVEQAMGRQALALLRQLDAACASRRRPRAGRRRSLLTSTRTPGSSPASQGIGALTGARVLAEIGDDRSRFADARGLKAYAGAAPITRASGKTRSVTARRVKNNRLAAAGYIWAFAALTASPGARAHYDRRRDAGDRHTAAQRNLFNRLLGCLHHCLATGQHYDEATAFPPATPRSLRTARRRTSASCLTTKGHRMSSMRGVQGSVSPHAIKFSGLPRWPSRSGSRSRPRGGST